ncbi:MAG: hypothetical protein DCF19_03005 [Pseudanabaena frigida]|uniref:Uncharacterized protein n=1 Tax=Pseudanabaena frigida TaxID=945775 RepID=A0A2W4YBI8_9CYAN|nr:MAG: hypothetical protein DCF19_03005 [Pseudanabaena frigida]
MLSPLNKPNCLLFQYQTAIASQRTKPDRLFPQIKQRSPLNTHKPDRLSMLLFYNEMSYIVQCNDTK